MKKCICHILLALTGVFAFALVPASCNDFLRVDPEDKALESQVFATEAGIHAALNGIYMDMASNNLYGENLTLTVLDVLGQRYQAPSSHTFGRVCAYNYADAGVKATFLNSWKECYAVILAVNAFLNQMDQTNVIGQAKKDILQGEAYGLRAFLHFDLLRLFGPVYVSADSTALAIPYNESSKVQLSPLLPANEVMNRMLADLSRAEVLLKNDPVMKEGVVDSLTNDDAVDFYRFRNRRVNYYAVKALQARVLLYRGDKEGAMKATQAVLSLSKSPFPWTSYAKAVTEKSNPDRIFSTEVIFGLHNADMYQHYTRRFAPDLRDESILAPLSGRLNTVYECTDANPSADYRFVSSWSIPTNGQKSYRTFYKFDKPADVTKVTFSYFQPLIRISELYYIAAECEQDADKAREYLNTVRYHRGLNELAATAVPATEIQKEYLKEFLGEGQIFYFFKRKASTTIPNANSASGNVSMSAAAYVVPLPDEERSYR